ncbi:unnamed protein product [Calicophoron daubneyi]|uniref:SCP domain-containing protein n=1 Tax=Calicophoron daubneyi TaxID=300641 RepID=A0AAV2THE9_CALDB
MALNHVLNNECIREHNILRALHGCAPLQMDVLLASKAQIYAEQLAKLDQFENDQSNDYGENLAIRTSSGVAKLTGRQATLMWYSEIANYDFSKENQLSCGHFSQVVWKSTTHAGFGCAVKEDGHKIYLVGIYLPPGNYKDEWVENVPPPLNGRKYLPSDDDINGLIRGMPPPDKIEEEIVEENSAEMVTAAVPQNKPDERTADGERAEVKRPSVSRAIVPQECVQQESRVAEVRFSWKNGIWRVISITEWFSAPASESGEDKGTSVHTWYEAKTGNVLQMLPEDEIVGYVSDDEAQLEAFRCEVLHTHNRYRKMHATPPLIRSTELDELAQIWATQLRENKEPTYSEWQFENQPLGENVSYRIAVNNRISGQTLVGKWYKESQNYDYTREPESAKKVGHFTQMIWKNTKQLGVAMVPSDEPNKAYIVCFYHPPGNAKEQFVHNVLPPVTD